MSQTLLNTPRKFDNGEGTCDYQIDLGTCAGSDNFLDQPLAMIMFIPYNFCQGPWTAI